jgi:two-component system, NtrC family, sensor histidine kinase KinB
MKTSIRTKFILGIVFFFVIIALLTIMSAFQVNKLSKKTSMVLMENEFSVIYARDMFDQLTNINMEITNSFLNNRIPDSIFVNKSLKLFDKSLLLEKNNITEVGEDKLVSSIASGYKEYRDTVTNIMKTPGSIEKVANLQKNYKDLDQQLMQLSQMNEKAMNFKIDEANNSANKSLMLISIIGTLCFLIALSFAYNFASYFNDRFSQLYKGIKEIASNNPGQRLHFEKKDEFHEISVVFNEMAEKLNKTIQRPASDLNEPAEKNLISVDVQELKTVLLRMKRIEEQALRIIAELENNK